MIHQRIYYKLQSICREYLPVVNSSERVISGKDIKMEYKTLGRTNLQVSSLVLGCGGPSALGLKRGKSKKEAKHLIRQALDLGINFLDTANDYGTEPLIGAAIKDIHRESIVLSSKIRMRNLLNQRLTKQKLNQVLQKSLKNLKTDYLDICHIASVTPQDYVYVQTELVPCLLQLQKEGKIRFLGITEKFCADTSHEMLKAALKDDFWDVMMVGFNLLNQSARELIFPLTQKKNIGVMAMYAVRKALRSEKNLAQAIEYLKQTQQMDPKLTVKDVQEALIGNQKALTLQDAAYRFCSHEPGVDVVLSGTGNLRHLEENILSIIRPPLPPEKLSLAHTWFSQVSNFSGD